MAVEHRMVILSYRLIPNLYSVKQRLLLLSSLDGGPLGKALPKVDLVTGGNLVFIG